MADKPNPNSGVKTFYDILDVSKNASGEEIRAAYKKLSRQYHPDVNASANSTAMMQAINEAYEGLGRPGSSSEKTEVRAAYDRKIAPPPPTPTTEAAEASQTQRGARHSKYWANQKKAWRDDSVRSQTEAEKEEREKAKQERDKYWGQPKERIYQNPQGSTPQQPAQSAAPGQKQSGGGAPIPGKNYAGSKAWQAFSKTGLGKAVAGWGSKLGGAAKVFSGAGKLLGGLSNPIGWAITAGAILANRKTYEYIIGGFLALGSLFGAAGAALVGIIGAGIGLLGITAIAVALGSVVLIAFFMFIINSGAYIMPPSTAFTDTRDVPGNVACFKFDTTWNNEIEYLTNTISGIEKLTSTVPSYIAKVCAGGDILLQYRPSDVTYGGLTPRSLRGSAIWLGRLGVSSVESVVYTLAHESGHVLSYRTTILQVYADHPLHSPTELDTTGPKKGIICTYPFDDGDPYWGSTAAAIQTSKTFENFAEMIALYISQESSTRSFSCLEGGNLQTKYPKHWQFANTNLFD